MPSRDPAADADLMRMALPGEREALDQEAGADRILSEDFQAGQGIQGLLIENPFL